jgi:hypothetical protein
MSGGCASGKVGYVTVKAARTALNACKRVRRHFKARRERAFYLCPGCREYHLTSELPNGTSRFE